MEFTAQKIYFSGSIRGGRQHVIIYKEIIDLLRNYGTVLTEHISDPDLSETGEGLSDAEIYQRDIKWLYEADVVVAEVSVPSLGVGYEIARAEELRKPILCLYRTDSEHLLSAMIAGNRRITLYRYTDANDLKNRLESFLKNVR